jgi:hypothetical protein
MLLSRRSHAIIECLAMWLQLLRRMLFLSVIANRLHTEVVDRLQASAPNDMSPAADPRAAERMAGPGLR